jgi:DNA-directed RNA polymerase subunit RPC12/RpoP
MNKLLSGLKRLLRRPFERHKDMTLRCVQCGKDFRFEWGEQVFYKSRGLTPPKRCPACRSESRGGGDRSRRRHWKR